MSENTCERTVEHWRRVLRAALRDAMRGRQLHAMAVLRDTLAAIDNAEAVEVGEAPPALEDGVIAGAAAGLGAGEVPRRVLSAEVVTAIVARELQDRRDAAAALHALGRHDEARTLELQVQVLAALR